MDNKQQIEQLHTEKHVSFFRDNPAHFTASAFITTPAMDKVLMVHHHLFQTFTWPGGHADGESDLLSVALREAREETGVTELYPLTGEILSLDTFAVPAHTRHGKTVEAHTHYSAAFGCIAPEGQALQVKPDENSAVQWIPADKLEQYCNEPHVLPIYRRILSNMRKIASTKQALYQQLPGSLIPWYRENARVLPWRADTLPYHVWLSEIMLQQTRVEAVKNYYTRFLQELPTIEALACAPEDKLLKLWEGLGYYNRARNLQKAAQQIMQLHHGAFPSDYKEIRSLPGIGAYTAGAVASICFEQPVAAVDGNVLRVISRITEEFRCIDNPKLKEEIALALETVYPAGQCGDFTQSLMELGATVCTPERSPKCQLCPAKGFCMAYRNGTQAVLPVKQKKRPRRIEEKTVFVLSCGNTVAVRKRNKKGLLAGLWEFPNIEGCKSVQQALDTAEEWGLKPKAVIKRLQRSHIFTHVEWQMTCYYIQCSMTPDSFTWAQSQQLQQEIALPTAFRMFLEDMD